MDLGRECAEESLRCHEHALDGGAPLRIIELEHGAGRGTAHIDEHAIDARDAALALANAATRDVGGATFIVGGGEGWSGSFSALMARLLRARGVPPIPDEAYRRADPLVDDAWYYEDLCDPSASQAALDYQRHGVEDHLAAIRPPAMTRLALRLGGPLVRRGMVKDSPYLGRPQAPDGAEIWTRVCETFGLDPAWRDRPLP
jgi:hypothetical protein